MSVTSSHMTVTAMLTVLTLLGALTVPVCLATLELDSSVVSLLLTFLGCASQYLLINLDLHFLLTYLFRLHGW